MKLLSNCLVAGVLITFFSGCNGSGYYTPSQEYAQHADYDPTGHLSRYSY